MQRDKRGRFVKKAHDGTIITLDGKSYKVKSGATQAFTSNPGQYSTFNDWFASEAGAPFREEQVVTGGSTGGSTGSLNFGTSGFNTGFSTGFGTGSTFGNQSFTPKSVDYFMNQAAANARIRYTKVHGSYVDANGTILNAADISLHPEKYMHDPTLMITPDYLSLTSLNNVIANRSYYGGGTSVSGDGTGDDGGDGEDKSAGMNWFKDKVKGLGEGLTNAVSSIDKSKLANYLDYARAGIGAAINNKVAERALEAEKPFLQDVSESHRSVYGDYRSQVEGEKAAAQLRNMASKPLTSDGALQQQMMMEAQIKGQEYIDKGNAADEAMIRQTREVAWQQEKENQQQRQAAAMANKQALMMSEKNKADIKNMRDSANYSQIAAPLLAEQSVRLRAEGAEQDQYNDYYKDALVTSEVWNTFEDGLTDSQKLLRNEYLTGGVEGLSKYIGEGDAKDVTKENDWLRLQQIMNNEIIRRKAAIRGVKVNPTMYNPSGFGTAGFSWEPSPMNFKKGGTVYKAKLSKRTKDNDRAARSIESSKRIAARFLEKAIDSLYTYDQVELIAKPKKSKKRKYQAGGGLPFVSYTPTFATSERGASQVTPTAAKDDSKEDLTSKDVLTLLKDMDGLPTDMQLIVESLKNFEMMDKMDPLGLSSSSNIASRYISLINKIKVAKFNREEYNNAFEQLKGNGGLNEFAVTSEGYLLGSNAEGDFQMFTPDQVNAGEHKKLGYSLLTNSNLLYLRANSPDAAFNHKLTTFAQNGIGMEVITKQVHDIIQGLGKSKETEEGFVQMGNNGQVKKGIEFLRKVMSEVGDESILKDMSVADYYQAGYMTEDQATQAQLALNYIWSALPANAQALLQVKGGGRDGAQALVQSLVYSKTSTDVQFKATPKKMSASSSGSKSGKADSVDELKLTPVQMMQVGYTDHMPVTLQKGTKYATRVNAQVLPITDVNKKLLGVTTLDRVAESTFGGALDMNNVTMGSQLIDPHALQNVQIDSTNLYVMNLPIDRSSPDGTIKPDLAWMTKIEQIDQTIRNQGITDIATINKLYTDAGLPVLMDDNGNLNLQDYCKFGVLNGHALNSAFKDLDLLDNTVIEIDDEDQISNVMSILNKGRNEKDRIDFDSKSWADSIFGTDHDSLYEGTIYIPIRTNAFTGMIGGGEYPEVGTAAEVEALIQQKERTRGYVDPGLLN